MLVNLPAGTLVSQQFEFFMKKSTKRSASLCYWYTPQRRSQSDEFTDKKKIHNNFKRPLLITEFVIADWEATDKTTEASKHKLE